MANNYYTDCHKDEYKLIHPEKYMENIDPPISKSRWEYTMFAVCDINPFITKWGYEPFAIAYNSPVYMKQAIYRPDIYLECRYPDGREAKYLIEIKPTAYSVLPKAPKPPPAGCTDQAKLDRYAKRKLNYDRKNMDVMVNYAKWEAAAAWCKARGVNWLIANEKNMKGLFDPSIVI
ncbi:MAG: hypothetical protein MJZ25_03685 [Fibrobacter sp.]|nr:hypothetical protein [Fibrobacter sp.]